MPISKSEFESGKVLSDLEKRIIAFLEKNRANAYTVDEMMDGINLQTDFRDFWKSVMSGIIIFGFPSVLNNLANAGKIRVNVIKGTYYYMAK